MKYLLCIALFFMSAQIKTEIKMEANDGYASSNKSIGRPGSPARPEDKFASEREWDRPPQKTPAWLGTQGNRGRGTNRNNSDMYQPPAWTNPAAGYQGAPGWTSPSQSAGAGYQAAPGWTNPAAGYQGAPGWTSPRQSPGAGYQGAPGWSTPGQSPGAGYLSKPGWTSPGSPTRPAWLSDVRGGPNSFIAAGGEAVRNSTGAYWLPQDQPVYPTGTFFGGGGSVVPGPVYYPAPVVPSGGGGGGGYGGGGGGGGSGPFSTGGGWGGNSGYSTPAWMPDMGLFQWNYKG